jgi:hypothetical protein
VDDDVSLAVLVPVLLELAVSDPVDVVLADALLLLVPDDVDVDVSLGVVDGDALGLAPELDVAVADPLLLDVSLTVVVDVPLLLAVSDAVEVPVALAVDVSLAVLEPVALLVVVPVGVPDPVDVPVAVTVGDCVIGQNCDRITCITTSHNRTTLWWPHTRHSHTPLPATTTTPIPTRPMPLPLPLPLPTHGTWALMKFWFVHKPAPLPPLKRSDTVSELPDVKYSPTSYDVGEHSWNWLHCACTHTRVLTTCTYTHKPAHQPPLPLSTHTR